MFAEVQGFAKVLVLKIIEHSLQLRECKVHKLVYLLLTLKNILKLIL